MTTDVVFEVGERQAKSTHKKAKASHVNLFHAHRLIFQKIAPKLAEMCGSGTDMTDVPISDVKLDIFHHMYYIFMGIWQNLFSFDG